MREVRQPVLKRDRCDFSCAFRHVQIGVVVVSDDAGRARQLPFTRAGSSERTCPRVLGERPSPNAITLIPWVGAGWTCWVRRAGPACVNRHRSHAVRVWSMVHRSSDSVIQV